MMTPTELDELVDSIPDDRLPCELAFDAAANSKLNAWVGRIVVDNEAWKECYEESFFGDQLK